MGGSSNLWPLQLYIPSTTASLTPGQCYSEFNEGAFMNEYSRSYRQQLRTWVRKSLNAPGLLVHCHLVSFQNPLVSATSSDFSIQAVIFHLWLSQRSHSGQKRYQGVSKKSICSLSPWILFCSFNYSNNEASVARAIWDGLFTGSVCLHSLQTCWDEIFFWKH